MADLHNDELCSSPASDFVPSGDSVTPRLDLLEATLRQGIEIVGEYVNTEHGDVDGWLEAARRVHYEVCADPGCPICGDDPHVRVLEGEEIL